jgi:hypothetical protein
MIVWGNCDSTYVSKSNYGFAFYFLTLLFYPSYFELKMQFAPGPLCDVNGVKYIVKRLKCPFDFTPT